MIVSTWYAETVEESLKTLKSTPTGLTTAEAARRFDEYGPNKLPHEAAINPWLLFLRQFHNTLIYVLIGVALVTFLLHHYLDTVIVIVIVMANAAIGYFQEMKAENSLEKLENMLALRAKVLRDNEPHEINAETLVPGDVVIIEPGTKVPADLRVVENIDLRVDESALTGEAIPVAKKVTPVHKQSSLGDRRNMLYSGTFVTSGRGYALVVATGSSTEFGKIANSLDKAAPPPSSLQIQLSAITKQLILVIIATMILLIVIGLIRRLDTLTMFLTGINLAVSAIPEGLPAVLTITLAIGVRRMARQEAIIRYLPAVETLGSVTLVATDKTGTLTRDEMVIERIYSDPNMIEVSGSGYTPEGRFRLDGQSIDPINYPSLKRLLTFGAICNDTSLVQEGKEWKITGDPTEGSLVVAAAKAGLTKPELEERYHRLDEIPFHTAKRFMATLHKDREDGYIIAAKGAVEKILPMCQTYYSGNHRHRITSEIKQKFLDINRELAGSGYRILAIALKDGHKQEKVKESDLCHCTLLGLCAMSDAPREEAHAAITQAHNSDIRVVMLTGDHALTAQSVAYNLDILSEKDSRHPFPVVTGDELDTMSNNNIKETIRFANVYARISPLNKLELVRRFQKLGHIVAVTGDGINDAPALKQADIGIAMGKTGTDVSREASDMVLANDNFTTIIKAIEEGRTVYQNIKRVILYLISTNVGEVMVIAGALLLGLPLPLQPVQILWINLITDGAATIPLALEPKHADIMKYPPRSPAAPLIDTIMRWRILLVGMVMTVGTLILYKWELSHSGYADARTVAFEAMVLFQIFNMFNCRSLKNSVFRVPLLTNPYVFWSFIVAWGLTIFAIYLPPLQRIFYTTALDFSQWTRIIIVSLSVIAVVEIEKWFRQRLGSKY